MTEALAERTTTDQAIEQALIGGDLSKLTPAQRLAYYHQVCDSLGLNPLTKPFEYILLGGKLVLYAKKDCTDQLRNLRDVSLTIPARELVEECYVVTAHATLATGRHDEAIGVVPLAGLKGEFRANAMMKAETKAKRRVTLSVCGLGWLDETEAEAIPGISVQPLETALAPESDPAPARAPEKPAAKAPTNFAAWFNALRQAAEQGEPTLRRAWEDSDSKLKKHLRENHSDEWMSLKQIAARIGDRRETGEEG